MAHHNSASDAPSSKDPAAKASSADAKPAVVAQLEKCVDGLLMPSETDAPIRAFFSPESIEEPKPADYARMAGIQLKGDEPLETRSLSDLLDNAAEVEDWMEDAEKKTAHRFADLRAFLNANLAEIEVLAWGTTEKQIVVAGRVEGGFAGIVTLVVET